MARAGCSEVEYLNSRDATIMGSRNGHAPIYMWYTLTLKGYEGMRLDVERCLRNAHLLKVRFFPLAEPQKYASMRGRRQQQRQQQQQLQQQPLDACAR